MYSEEKATKISYSTCGRCASFFYTSSLLRNNTIGVQNNIKSYHFYIDSTFWGYRLKNIFLNENVISHTSPKGCCDATFISFYKRTPVILFFFRRNVTTVRPRSHLSRKLSRLLVRNKLEKFLKLIIAVTLYLLCVCFFPLGSRFQITVILAQRVQAEDCKIRF